ncbi:MAG: hypothetical protein AAGA68_25585 [Pseudomonadota bacterium]
MLGENWERWKQLFVPTLPGASRLLAADLPTVVTGARGCGKTMVFRRLSERARVKCGAADIRGTEDIVGFYVNANDIADAFPNVNEADPAERAAVTCFFNLSLLSEVLTVHLAHGTKAPEPFVDELESLLGSPSRPLLAGESTVNYFRSRIEELKWMFLAREADTRFPGYAHLSSHVWFERFIEGVMQPNLGWMSARSVLLFVDDYTLPRVCKEAQLVLNRVVFRRSSAYVSKIATEATTTIVYTDTTRKTLEDNNDYYILDMSAESFLMTKEQRVGFLSQLFASRLRHDKRVPNKFSGLSELLGETPHGKVEHARRLRAGKVDIGADSSRSGETKYARGNAQSAVYYCGKATFCDLWSGDTRSMIQVMHSIVDAAIEKTRSGSPFPVDTELQDATFKAKGSQLLDAITRHEPSDSRACTESSLLQETVELRKEGISFKGLVNDSYGHHLRAIVEAFKEASLSLLRGPMYRDPASKSRLVPRMAYRIEIVDSFRVDGLASVILDDLVRYGVFLRDSRGKSIRGTLVPRLFLRRLLLPRCTMPLSSRDSVQLSCREFRRLLLCPDEFQANLARKLRDSDPKQDSLFGDHIIDPSYDDLDSTDLDQGDER